MSNKKIREGYTMGEMISSFDGMKLYLNREVPENPKAALVIVHGLLTNTAGMK